MLASVAAETRRENKTALRFEILPLTLHNIGSSFFNFSIFILNFYAREGGAMHHYQVCYEGDLTLELASAVRRLKGEPNFDNSWSIRLNKPRAAAVLLRYLKRFIAADGHLIVTKSETTRERDFILVRHSVTAGFDYAPLRRELAKIGFALDLPTEATFIIKTASKTNAHILGDRLEELCPYDSLMVAGISHDFAVWSSTGGMFVACEGWLVKARAAV